MVKSRLPASRSLYPCQSVPSPGRKSARWLSDSRSIAKPQAEPPITSARKAVAPAQFMPQGASGRSRKMASPGPRVAFFAALVSFGAAKVALAQVSVATQAPFVASARDSVADVTESDETFVAAEASAVAVGGPVCPADERPAECQCDACQAKKAADLKASIAGAYKPLFYDNNFAY